MPGPIQAITNAGRFCSNVISHPVFPFVYALASYAGMEVSSLIAATIQMSKAFDQVTHEWVTRANFWRNATEEITESFCCYVQSKEYTSNDCPFDYSSAPHDHFRLADQVVNKLLFINPEPTANYGGLTSVIPIIFGVIFLALAMDSAGRFDRICCEMLVAFLALLPYLFVVFDLGAFNTLSGGIWAANQLCDLPHDSLEAVSNPYNSSALFLTQFYNGNDSQILFLPVILLQASAMAVAYFSAYLNRRIERREVFVDLEEARPLLWVAEVVRTPADVVRTPAVAAAPVKKSLTYEEKIDFINEKTPEFFTELKEKRPELFCPITQSPMVEPVVASDGHFYDRAALSRWLQCSNKSPMMNTTCLTDTAESIRRRTILDPLRSSIVDIIDRQYHSLCQTAGKESPAAAAASADQKSLSGDYHSCDESEQEFFYDLDDDVSQPSLRK